MARKRIAIIGAGNVATHLARALDSKCDVIEVCSRDIEHAKALASSLRDCKALDDVAQITKDADYYIISVNDDAIRSVASRLSDVTGIVMHTSGSVGIDALDQVNSARGVFYPLQTFSKSVDVDARKVPFFIEASSEDTLREIESLAREISESVHYADSHQRTVLHIAAVFGCNFVNHLLDISSQILEENGYSLEVLRPLLEVTIDKAMSVSPHHAQTGPAARGDKGIINKHISALTPERAEIYRLLSQSIMNRR